MPQYVDCEPKVSVGSKNVQICSLSMSGLQVIAETMRKAKLPFPRLGDRSLTGWIDEITSTMDRLASSTELDEEQKKILSASAVAKIRNSVIELIVQNMDTFKEWFLGHAPVVRAVILATTNLTPEEYDELRVSDSFVVATCALRRAGEDGVLENAAGFFGGLLTMGKK